MGDRQQATWTLAKATWRRFVAWLADLPPALAESFQEESRATLFSAALAVIATQIGFLTIFAKLSLLIVANFAAHTEPILDGKGPVVVLLNEARWQDRYLELSPLDRCVLADDLSQILSRAPRSLAVDFDLSPTIRPQDRACQARLDALLDQHAAKLVLLAPFRVSSPQLIAQKRAWMLQRCHAGTDFADGDLDQSLGMVIDTTPGENHLAEVVHHRHGGSICNDVAAEAGSSKWLTRIDDDKDDGPESVGGGESVAINFAGFSAQGYKVTLDTLGASKVKDWPERDVFFGGDYGGSREDQFKTPIGTLPGVAVHAARFLSLDHPVSEVNPIIGFVTDILTAFIFSLAIAYFWQLYAGWRLWKQHALRPLGSAVVVLFVAFYAGLVALFFKLGTDLFAVGILIAPLVVAVSMLIDGFITGPVGAVINVFNHEEEAPSAPGDFFLVIGLMCIAGLALYFRYLITAEYPLDGRLIVLVVALVVALVDVFRWRRNLRNAKLHETSTGDRPIAPSATRDLPRAPLPSLVLGSLGIVCGVIAVRMLGLPMSRYLSVPFVILLSCISVMMAGGFFYPSHAHGAVAGDSAAKSKADGGALLEPTPLPHRRQTDVLFSPGFFGRYIDHPGWQFIANCIVVIRKVLFWLALCAALSFLLHS